MVSKSGVEAGLFFNLLVALLKRLSLDLERLTEPPDRAQDNEACSEGRKGLVDAVSAFVTDRQATEAVEPGVGSLDDPAATAESLAALDTFASNARDDAAGATHLPPALHVVSFVGVHPMPVQGTGSRLGSSFRGGHGWPIASTPP